MITNLQEAISLHNPFLDNKYTKWYLNLVLENNNSGAYVERHHILPKCLFPEYKNSSWNIVKLSARQHFIAHILLYKMFKKNTEGYGKMLTASLRMKTHNTNNRYVNSRLYEQVKVKFGKYISENRCWSEEHKQRISQKLKGIIRGPMSEEAKQKMIASKKASHVPKIWMYKGDKETKVVYDKINTFLSDGWTKGVLKEKRFNSQYKEKQSQKARLQWKKQIEFGLTGKLQKIQ
jgi:hypothetical protein